QWHGQGAWPKPLVVFADPVFASGDPRIEADEHGASVPAPDDHLGRADDLNDSLAGALRNGPGFAGAAIPRRCPSWELGRIERVASGAEVLMGFEATRAAATNGSLAKYRIVHFATHGIIDDRHPERSGVILSLFDRRGRPQDGYLRLRDIRNLWLP